jgi:type IV secretion system protein VirB11
MVSPAFKLRALPELLMPLSPFMEDESLTEIAVQEPNVVWTEGTEGWNRHIIDLPEDRCIALAHALAGFNDDHIDQINPVLTGNLPSRERLQMIYPPAVYGGCPSFTIRKFSDIDFTLEQLRDQGAFDNVKTAVRGLSETDRRLLELRDAGRWYEFIKLAVKSRKNIIIGGATGSGKTVLNKSMIHHIDPRERVITIEDTHELFMRGFPNKVHLLYKNKDGSNFTSRDALASCVRMKPDRILLAELRGPETLDYIESLNTGHPGSITSIHANNAFDVFSRLVQLIKKSETGLTLDSDYIRAMCEHTIDVVLFYHNRKLVEVIYEPERKLA